MTRDWHFHTATTTTGTGDEFKIPNTTADTMITLSISGTATSYSLKFEAKGLTGDYEVKKVFSSSTGSGMTAITQADGKIYIAGLAGLSAFRCNITAINGGNLTVYGRVVE